MACDMELNIAVVKIKSVEPLPTASLKPFNDWISVSPLGVSERHAPFSQSPCSTNVFPGDEVTVVCCPFDKFAHCARACSGIYSVDYIGFQFDHKPFLRISCEKIISGAPVINCEGDVIGVAFHVRDCAVFLPVNVFFKWWKQVVTYGEIRRPWMGIQICNLYTADIGYLEAIVHDCDYSDGVIVEEVIHESPADSANMCSTDVICQCDGRPVRSFLEFTELLWDKVGEVIEAKGVRRGRHFVWKVEIQAIKTGILPESLVALAENVVTTKKSTKSGRNKAKDKKKSKKDKEVTGLEAKKRKRVGKSRAGTDADGESPAESQWNFVRVFQDLNFNHLLSNMIRRSRLHEKREPDTLNPWMRMKKPNYGRAMFAGRVANSSKAGFNAASRTLDAYAKRAVLNVSPSVVSLTSYSGGKKAFWCSGVIFGCFWKNDSLYYSVLTSATLLRPPPSHVSDCEDNLFRNNLGKRRKPEDNECLPIDGKIDVYVKGGNLSWGTVVTYDPHYNIAVLTFKSDIRLSCAVLRPLDDSLARENAPINAQGSACRVHHLPVKLIPGDAVIAVGRYTEEPFEIRAAPGKYSVDCFDENVKFNCMELFRADCKITKCGIGGPLISYAGDVIGINFYTEHCTPFLPINIFLKWWSYQRITGTYCRPSLGMKVANLHTADLRTLDQVRKLGISQGVTVQKGLSGSPAEICGLRPGDVVFKCSDTTVVSPLQLFEVVWDMAGKSVEVAVVREGSYKNMKIEVKDITSADESTSKYSNYIN